MSREENLATQERLGKKLAEGDVDAAVEAFAEDCVDHDPADGQGPGREGFRTFMQTLSTAFPNVAMEPQQLVADDDFVTVAYTLTGTHRGDYQGIEPTGRSFSVRGVQIARFEDGQIVERWGSTDELGIVRQLGAEVQPA